jgi:AraC family transcriptional regulator, exoenzyme S synthesis regulatory protein ExsA
LNKKLRSSGAFFLRQPIEIFNFNINQIPLPALTQQELKIYDLPNDFSTREELSHPVMIRAYQSPQKSLRNKSIIHWNMIDIILMGRKTIIDVSNINSLETGELMLLSKGSYLISQALPENGLFKSVVLYFTNEFLADFYIKYSSLTKEECPTPKEPPVPKERPVPKAPFLKYQQDAFIKNYIVSLQVLIQSPEINSPEFKAIKAEELLLYLLHHDPAKLQSLEVMARDSEEMTLRKVVESTVGTRVTVEELAFLCHTSLSSFKRRFIKIYGMPPQKWLVQQKMQLAAGLLKHPDERSGSVFEKVGYDSQSSFTKAFRLQYGMTPKAFQEKHLACRD